MFKIIEFRDRGMLIDAEIDGKSADSVKPYLKALVEERDGDSDNGNLYRILEVKNAAPENLYLGSVPEFGDYHFADNECVAIVLSEKDFSDEQKKNALQYSKQFSELHENAPYIVNGSVFGEEAKYYSWDKNKTFPTYELIEEKRFECPDYVNTLDKARLWMLENHPDYYMGCSISQDCRSGNFLCLAAPGFDYAKGSFESYENRRKYAEHEFKDLCTKIPMMHEEEIRKLGKKELDENRLIVREREKETEIVETAPETEKHLDKNYYIIWQRDDDDAFENSRQLKEKGIALERRDFQPVYIGKYEGQSPDELYILLQNGMNAPDDYKSRSLSVGDVITINDEGIEKNYFVDRIGFKEEPEFTKQMYLVNGIIYDKEQMSNSEIAIFEDTYGIDINSDSAIGIEKLAVDRGDRDTDGNGIADKYDYDLER